MKNELKEVFGVLVLFFCLTVISIVMVFSKFESKAVEFWNDQEELVKAADALTQSDVFDLDNTKTAGGVDKKEQNSTLSK